VKFVVVGVFLLIPCLGCGLLAAMSWLSPKSAPPAFATAPSHELGKTVTQPNRISIPSTGVIRISVDELLAQFRADEDAADRVFRDRAVEVTGKVASVWKRKTGEPVVTFGDGRVASPEVECYFEARADLKVLVGQSCVIRGQCMGRGRGAGTWLKECILLSTP